MSSRQATDSSCFVHTMRQIYEEGNKSALEYLCQQGTFKSWALWSVRDGKGLIINKTIQFMEKQTADEYRKSGMFW